MDQNPPSGELEAVREALRRGNKIGAIKLYREATGLGLKEAKDAVEAMESGGSPGSPAGSGAPLSREDPFGRKKAGCLGLLAALALVLAAVVACLVAAASFG
jgi:hypothetical protein